MWMVNKNYRKGRRKEYRICKKLREQGFDIAQRSAGSHSPVDVWAVNKEKKEILLVQSKPRDISDRKEQELMQENSSFNGKYKVKYIIM